MPDHDAAPGAPRPSVGAAAGPPRQRLAEESFTLGELPRLRLIVEAHATRAGLPEPRRGDFVFAVDAVASHAIEHAGGRGVFVLDRHGHQLECRISDNGPGLTEDTCTQRPPVGGSTACGHGLWLTRRITDRLTITRKLRGTVVTLAMSLL